MVNDKMKRAGKAYATYAEGGPQSIINAAWTDLDPDDKSTWPKTKYPDPNDKRYPWFVEDEWETISFGHWTGDSFLYVRAVRYADPRDLLYVKKGSDDVD